MVESLSPAARDAALTRLPGWRHDPGRDALVRRFDFSDFAEAFAFMTRVAALAEAQDHHPEWSNVYNRVDIALTTHDADGVSQRDIDMANAIEGVLAG